LYNANDTVTGNSDSVTDETASTAMTFDGSSSGIALASGDTLNLGSGSLGNTLYCSNDTINGVSGTSFTLNGTSDTINASGATITVSNLSSNLIGSSNTVIYDISNTTINLDGDGGDKVIINGSNDEVEAIGVTGENIIIDGNTDVVASSGEDNGLYFDTGDSGDTYDGGAADGGGYFGNDGLNADDGSGGGGYELVRRPNVGGSTIDVIAQYDKEHGYTSAAQSAEMAWQQANDMADSPAQRGSGAVNLEGSKQASDVITWSLADSPGTGASPFSDYMGSGYQALVEDAFQAWGRVSGLTFVETPDSSQSDIRIGFGDFNTSASGVAGFTSYQSNEGKMLADTIVRLEDPAQDRLVRGAGGTLEYAGTDAGFYQVLLHEIGHALGLADDADPNSIMYYMATSGNTKLDTTDIAGVQDLYGTQAHQLVQAMASFGASTSASSPHTMPLPEIAAMALATPHAP
jgi:hypothetical protein